MVKKFRFLMAAALLMLFSTNAVAEDSSSDSKARTSADGSYQFKPSWGIGLQYGLTFTDMQNWNDYLLIPAKQNYFDANFVAEHELYVEVTPVEGFRLSAFGGFQSLYISDTGFNYGYGGIEPAFSVRRSFYEFAVGLGLGYGKSWLDSSKAKMEGHGLLVRPFVEARFYPADIFAIYLRIAFAYYKEFGLEPSDYAKSRDIDKQIDTDKLSYAGPNIALGIRFGNFEAPVVHVGDSDGDGVLDDIDDCKDEAGSKEFNGCPNPDSDGDGYCDPWVSEKGLSDQFSKTCKGTDKCTGEAEDLDGFEDEDGCPDPDNDGDGVCDSWVSEKGLADKYASVCKGADKCSNESEDLDGNIDDDGCPEADNDGDGLCDPWVSAKGLSSKYASECKAIDYCPNYHASDKFFGCENPDPDDDGFCDAWVYENDLQNVFTQCKGKDVCPNEKGDDAKGCIKRRVEVTADKIEINEAINFALNKATIQKSSDSLLEEIAGVFKNNPQIKKVEIQGHTDLSGNAKKNMKLSNDRAKSVYDRLVKLGVEKDRMTYKGYGMSQPVEPLAKGQKKETAEQAAKNRRVVFNILEQDEVKTTMTIREAKEAGYTRDDVKVLSKEESAKAAAAEADKKK
ncbi:MAG: OmpA family protein [Proteobacteria bacterium]|nr:OmpA family protein [Pseudomonadota bacterium]